MLVRMEARLTEPLLVTPPELQDVLAELSRREPIFHRPEFGISRADFERITDDDFWETGASGRRYSRNSVLDGLEKRSVSAPPRPLGDQGFLLSQTGAGHLSAHLHAAPGQAAPDAPRHHLAPYLGRMEDPVSPGNNRPGRLNFLQRSTTAIANPSSPLTPTVCSANALSRGWAAIISRQRRVPRMSALLLLELDHAPVARNVVHHDHRSAPRELQRPFEILRVVLLVRVDEDQIERPPPFASSTGRLSSAGPTRISTRRSRPARAQIRARHFRVAGSNSSDTMRPPLRQRPRHPDRRVAAQQCRSQARAWPASSAPAPEETCPAAETHRSPAAPPSDSPDRSIEMFVGGSEQIAKVPIDRGPQRFESVDICVFSL